MFRKLDKKYNPRMIAESMGDDDDILNSRIQYIVEQVNPEDVAAALKVAGVPTQTIEYITGKLQAAAPPAAAPPAAAPPAAAPAAPAAAPNTGIDPRNFPKLKPAAAPAAAAPAAAAPATKTRWKGGGDWAPDAGYEEGAQVGYTDSSNNPQQGKVAQVRKSKKGEGYTYWVPAKGHPDGGAWVNEKLLKVAPTENPNAQRDISRANAPGAKFNKEKYNKIKARKSKPKSKPKSKSWNRFNR